MKCELVLTVIGVLVKGYFTLDLIIVDKATSSLSESEKIYYSYQLYTSVNFSVITEQIVRIFLLDTKSVPNCLNAAEEEAMKLEYSREGWLFRSSNEIKPIPIYWDLREDMLYCKLSEVETNFEIKKLIVFRFPGEELKLYTDYSEKYGFFEVTLSSTDKINSNYNQTEGYIRQISNMTANWYRITGVRYTENTITFKPNGDPSYYM